MGHCFLQRNFQCHFKSPSFSPPADVSNHYSNTISLYFTTDLVSSFHAITFSFIYFWSSLSFFSIHLMIISRFEHLLARLDEAFSDSYQETFSAYCLISSFYLFWIHYLFSYIILTTLLIQYWQFLYPRVHFFLFCYFNSSWNGILCCPVIYVENWYTYNFVHKYKHSIQLKNTGITIK